MWRHDQTKDLTNCAFRHLRRRCMLLDKWHRAAHDWPPLENFRDFVFRNRCSVQISLQRNAKKNVSELVSITNLLRQTSLEFGNCKIWSCLWVSHASSNQKRLGHLERLDLYLQYPDTTRTLKIANASHLKMVFVQTQQSHANIILLVLNKWNV